MLRQLSYFLWAVGWLIMVPFILSVSLSPSSDPGYFQLIALWTVALVPIAGGAISGELAYMLWNGAVVSMCAQGAVPWRVDDFRRNSQIFVWASWIVGGMALAVENHDILIIDCYSCQSAHTLITGILVGLLILFVALRMFHQLFQGWSVRLAAKSFVPGQSLVPTRVGEKQWSLGSLVVPLNPGIIFVIVGTLLFTFESSPSTLPGSVGAVAVVVGIAGILGSLVSFAHYTELNRRCRFWLRGPRQRPGAYGSIPPPPGFVPSQPASIP